MSTRKARKSDPNQRKLVIGDDLVIEILSRIPTAVVAIRCKLVCKSWCFLISSPYFMSRFKQQQHPKPLSGMLANTALRVNIAAEDDDSSGFNFLDYLPEKYDQIMVVASCNDLIICESQKCNYYLCNPFTMQWAALPPHPRPDSGWNCIGTGFVCRKPGEYRVVRFYKEYEHCYRQEMVYHVLIYCSETREWIRYVDRGKEYRVGSKVAGYNGKLHWVNREGEYFVTLDPFDMSLTSLGLGLIDGEYDNSWGCYGCHVEECEGVLRVMRVEVRPGWQAKIKGISVWELQEDRLISKEYIVWSERIRHIQKLGFHPSNKDVLFLENNDWLASFNTKTRKLKFETEFKASFSDPYFFTLQLPWWPTPISQPTKLQSAVCNGDDC